MTNALPSSCICLALLFIAGCAARQPIVPAAAILPTVGTVALQQSATTPANYQLLDIGVMVFANEPRPDDGLKFGEWVFAEVRENERHYLPYALRTTLVDSNQWGAVRVLPQTDPSVDLNIVGTVLDSDGSILQLHVKATDSTGRRWLDQVYTDTTAEEDFPESTRFNDSNRFDARSFVDPFQDIYDQIANDLLATRNKLNAAELVEIQRVSRMVYANELAPESFAQMLQRDVSGRLQLSSLPADDDPMLLRVAEMRLRHHLFIDTVDEYYQALYEDMQATYIIWRHYSFEQLQEEEAARDRAFRQEQVSSTSGFLTLTQRYDRFRWSKIYEQEFRELASGFNREVAPAILELNKQVHGLSGTMEEQYLQWRRILRQLFTLEGGAL